MRCFFGRSAGQLGGLNGGPVAAFFSLWVNGHTGGAVVTARAQANTNQTLLRGSSAQVQVVGLVGYSAASGFFTATRPIWRAAASDKIPEFNP